MFFFFNAPAPTEIYTLSLHDALPIYAITLSLTRMSLDTIAPDTAVLGIILAAVSGAMRSEEHTSELQSRPQLVCRLLLEKKKKRQSSPELGDPKGLTITRALFRPSNT